MLSPFLGDGKVAGLSSVEEAGFEAELAPSGLDQASPEVAAGFELEEAVLRSRTRRADAGADGEESESNFGGENARLLGLAALPGCTGRISSSFPVET